MSCERKAQKTEWNRCSGSNRHWMTCPLHPWSEESVHGRSEQLLKLFFTSVLCSNCRFTMFNKIYLEHLQA